MRVPSQDELSSQVSHLRHTLDEYWMDRLPLGDVIRAADELRRAHRLLYEYIEELERQLDSNP